MKKRIVSLMLVAAMSVSLCACGGKGSNATEPTEQGTETAKEESSSAEFVAPDADEYTSESSELYNSQLGDFYAAYQKAFEASTVSERYALMAVAEAKLSEAAVMIPTTSRGGRYAISRVVPYTVDYTLWGNDDVRYHSALVTTEFIKKADRDALRELWKETKGTGTYLAKAKEYVESHGYTLTNEYGNPYTADPETWDMLSSSRATVGEALVNCVDGLLEYDAEGVAQPALAESYEVSEDGLTYTFHLRKGVNWVDSQGNAIAELKANDFVKGFQHMMDTQSGLGDLERGVIVGVTEYLDEGAAFDTVGVKATDDYTVEYTLVEPCTYFDTTLEYNVFMPLCTSYYESNGGKYGAEFDASAVDYTYGVDPDHIAYCGPYTVTNATAGTKITFTKNESYYDPSKINVDTITWIFEDGSDPTKAYEDTKAGLLVGCSLTDSTLELATKDGMFDNDFVFTSSTNATSYMGFLNINRYATSNSNDTTKAASGRSSEDVAKTTTALQNVHMRRALLSALDRVSWNAQQNGTELAATNLINSYTPGNFVALTEDVTIDLGTFPAGTYYGQIMQAQLDADGIPYKVWNEESENDCLSSGYDGLYNVEYAKAELAKAAEELAEAGVVVDAENPVSVDLPYASADTTYTNKAQAFKKSIEDSLDGAVVVNLIPCETYDDWYYTGYYTTYGYEANYDIYDLSGWGPDYGDPSTYLNTFLPDYSGYMIKCLGIF